MCPPYRIKTGRGPAALASGLFLLSQKKLKLKMDLTSTLFPSSAWFCSPNPLKIQPLSWVHISLVYRAKWVYVYLFAWIFVFYSPLASLVSSCVSKLKVQWLPTNTVFVVSYLLIILISVTTVYSKPRYWKSHWVLSLLGTFPPHPTFYVNTYKKINILIMFPSNLVLTQSLTSLSACPAVARSYQARMPPRCPASLLPLF